MIEDSLVPLIAVGLAELGDKTQLAVLLLSSKTDKHLQLLLGVILAFLIVDGIAILFGSWITGVVSEDILKTASGLIFIAFGLLILRGDGGEADKIVDGKNPFLAGFSLIFLTEWGDKTQITAALFATRYDVLLVFLGVMASLTLLSSMAVYLGKFISERIDKRMVSKAAGIVFILMGLSFFLVSL